MAAQAKLKSRYKIKKILGQGGMGVMYRAYDTVIRRDVARETIRDIPDPAALENVSERVRRAGVDPPIPTSPRFSTWASLPLRHR